MAAPTASDPLVIETFAQRQHLAETLAALTSEQWSQPSQCAGWRVREVVAHITLRTGIRVYGSSVTSSRQAADSTYSPTASPAVTLADSPIPN